MIACFVVLMLLVFVVTSAISVVDYMGSLR